MADRQLRVGVWTAVSSEPQARPEKTSLDDQEQAGRRFAEAIGAHVAAVYRVPGHSRDLVFWHEAEAEMPAYRQVREDLEGHRLDVIHAVDADRLGRDAALISQFVSLAERHGCEVYLASMPHPIGQQSVGFRYLHAIAGVRAQEDNARRAYKHAAGMRGRITRRQLHPGTLPYGYRPVRDGDGRVIGAELDEVGAATVRFLTALFLEGHSYHHIAARANATGHTAPQGGPWTAPHVRRTLANDTYAGLLHWGTAHTDEPTPHMPALWDADLFAAVVRERQARARSPYNRTGSGPYTGVAYCARCGGRMARKPVYGPHSTYHYWRCLAHALDHSCHANNIPEARITAAVAAYLAEYATPEHVAQALAETGRGETHARLQADLATAQAAAQDLTKRRERLAHALAGGLLDAAMYRTTDDDLLARLDAETRRACDISREMSQLPDNEQRRAALTQLAADFPSLAAHAEPARLARALQLAGLRVDVETNKVRGVYIT